MTEWERERVNERRKKNTHRLHNFYFLSFPSEQTTTLYRRSQCALTFCSWRFFLFSLFLELDAIFVLFLWCFLMELFDLRFSLHIFLAHIKWDMRNDNKQTRESVRGKIVIFAIANNSVSEKYTRNKKKEWGQNTEKTMELTLKLRLKWHTNTWSALFLFWLHIKRLASSIVWHCLMLGGIVVMLLPYTLF